MKIIITESQRDSILGHRELDAFKNLDKDSYHLFSSSDNATNRLPEGTTEPDHTYKNISFI
jgi:hypothetical protein